MSDTQPVIACNLGALSEEEKTRRSAMAARVSARFQEIRETPDGYAARLDEDLGCSHHKCSYACAANACEQQRA